MTADFKLQDTLYGSITLPAEVAALIESPIVQRLRHVRLSNIDSTDMPGIANLSRFEHVLGVAYLATEVGLRRRIPKSDQLVLQAAALLHDWAITAFGHLVEEALQYAGTGFDHERRLRQIIEGELPDELGGVRRQIIRGRETGLPKWAAKMTGSQAQAEVLIGQITDHILGNGPYGKLVAGTIDLDNSDNLFRMAYHMGLDVNRAVPLRLARAIVDVDRTTREPIFSDSAEDDIAEWSHVRKRVYERLMLAPRDFSAKLMILFAATTAIRAHEISNTEWALNDHDLIQRLLSSSIREVRETIERWMAGELWDTTPLMWLSGKRPEYSNMLQFSEQLSKEFGRPCLAYAIKDKRHRRLEIKFESGRTKNYDHDQTKWVLGIGSVKRHSFTARDIQLVFDFASRYFGSRLLGPAEFEAEDDKQSCLL